MKPAFYLILILVMVLASSCNKEFKGNGDETKHTIEVGGVKRKYRVYTPEHYNGSTAYPVVFALHGRFGKGSGMDKFSNFNPTADSKGFIVVYPDGYKKSWHDDRHRGPAADAGIDDIAFFHAMIDQLAKDYSIDQDRIYACGMSNGGFMALSLACHMPERIAAVATVTGNMALDPQNWCFPSRGVPVMLIGGVDDPIAPYHGGVDADNGSNIGFPQSFDFWVTQNNCPGTEVVDNCQILIPMMVQRLSFIPTMGVTIMRRWYCLK